MKRTNPPKADSARQFIGYLRVSTAEQDTEKNKADILTVNGTRKVTHPCRFSAS